MFLARKKFRFKKLNLFIALLRFFGQIKTEEISFSVIVIQTISRACLFSFY